MLQRAVGSLVVPNRQVWLTRLGLAATCVHFRTTSTHVSLSCWDGTGQMPSPSPIETHPDDRPLLRVMGKRGATNMSNRVSEALSAASVAWGDMEQAAPLLAAARMESRKFETSFTSESEMEPPKNPLYPHITNKSQGGAL